MIATLDLPLTITPNLERGAWAPSAAGLRGVLSSAWLLGRPEVGPEWAERDRQWRAEITARTEALDVLAAEAGVARRDLPPELVRDLTEAGRIPRPQVVVFGVRLTLRAELRLWDHQRALTGAGPLPGAEVVLWRCLGGAKWRIGGVTHHTGDLRPDGRVLGARRWIRDADMRLADLALAESRRDLRRDRRDAIVRERVLAEMRARLGL